MGTAGIFLKKLPYAYKIFPKSEPIWLDIGLEIVKTAKSPFLIHIPVMVRIPVKYGSLLRVRVSVEVGLGYTPFAMKPSEFRRPRLLCKDIISTTLLLTRFHNRRSGDAIGVIDATQRRHQWTISLVRGNWAVSFASEVRIVT